MPNVQEALAKTPSQVFAERLKRVRKTKMWSQQDLADRLGEMGAPTDRATLARTESGARGLSLDDALMLAAALDVAPLALLLPDGEDTPVALAPRFKTPAEYVRRWMCALSPLPIYRDEGDEGQCITEDGAPVDRQAALEQARFFESSLPLNRWQAYNRPGVRHLVQTADLYASAVADDNRSEMKRCLQHLRSELDRQAAQMMEEEA